MPLPFEAQHISRLATQRFAYEERPGSRSMRPVLPMSGCSGRLLIAVVFALFAVVSYYTSTSEEVNAFTGRKQRLALNPSEEIQLGLASRAEMAKMHGGLSPDTQAREYVQRIGRKLVDDSD
ncbi:MAG: hypothetical protein ACOYMN_21910, partial [Roseimicrobium sp.]